PMPLVIGNEISYDGNIFAYYTSGIYISACPHAIVDNNTINTTNYNGWITGSGIPMIGIIMDNLGGLQNDVYKNTINNMDFAVEGIGKNRTDPAHPPKAGLKFLCNAINSINENS